MIIRRPTVEEQQQQRSAMKRFLTVLAALAAVIFLAKTSLASPLAAIVNHKDSEKASASIPSLLRQRQTTEGTEEPVTTTTTSPPARKKSDTKTEPPEQAANQKDVEAKQPQDSTEQDQVSSSKETGRTFVFEVASLKDSKTGEIVIQTHPEWAPIGCEHFHKLMDEGFYKDTKFFRVVPDFVIQWGIAADPKSFPDKKVEIKDDPVKQTNKKGRLTFATAGPNTRTTQLFINWKDNKFLDKQGFAPFAEIITGMDVVDQIYAEYGEEPSQTNIEIQGNAYLDKHYPLLSYIANTKSMEADDGTKEDEGGDE